MHPQIRRDLLQEFLAATAEHDAARQEFKAVMEQTPLVDSRTRMALSGSGMFPGIHRPKKMMAALYRLDEFLNRGIVPDDFKRRG